LAKNVAFYAVISGKIEKNGYFTGVQDLTRLKVLSKNCKKYKYLI